MSALAVGVTGARGFITREFADTIAGKTPAPYLRTHDPIQARLASLVADPDGLDKDWQVYLKHTLHFWREISLAGIKRGGRGADVCLALLFESVFELALARPDWAADCLANYQGADQAWSALRRLAHQNVEYEWSHNGVIGSFRSIYAERREADPSSVEGYVVVYLGDVWFWAAILCATQVDESHRLWWFHRGLSQLAADHWGDGRLHSRVIRESSLRSPTASRAELLAHPLLRLARLKYREGSAEQVAVLECLGELCINAGFESEDDYFQGDLALARWVRDARKFAGRLRRREPERYAALIEEAGEEDLARVRALFDRELGRRTGRIDALDLTRDLIRWGHRRRGHDCSQNRAEALEFVVETVDAALWLGWVFPSATGNREVASDLTA